MNPSPLQEAIFDAVLNTQLNICINATAGSGKTTTIVMASDLIKKKYPYKQVLFLAFNKSIVEELKKRLPESIDCSTIHSLGMRALMSHYKTQLRVDEFKTFKLAESVLEGVEFKGKEKDVYKFTLRDIIDLARMTVAKRDPDVFNVLCDRFDITTLNGEVNRAIELLSVLDSYNKSIDKKNNLIDFTDMVYLPAVNDNIRLKQYDIILVDESQDFNRAQHLFLYKLIKPGGRLISVGDKKQAIYAFAGADSNSFELFERRENTTSLPLSVCYRCAKSIVNNAQKVNNFIQPFEGQIEGEVRYGDVDEISKNDMVICRNVKPLVVLYFRLLEQDKKAFIKGRDIENGLIALFNKVKDFDKHDAIMLLNDKLEKLLEELQLKGIKKPKEHIKYLNLKEKIVIISIIASKVKFMFEVEKKIHELFSDKKDAIQLMTVHKSKGLESDRVFFIESFNGINLIPSEYAKSPWELEQENNLMFVALTRAKKSLIYLKIRE